MNGGVEAIVMDVHLPAEVAGPEPLDFDVRCFLVPHATGVVLVDCGMVGNADAIQAGLARIGAGWRDLTDVVLTHGHEDHVGGLNDVVARSGRLTVWAGADDHSAISFDGELQPLLDRGTVRNLRVIQTPGHTAGHCSLVMDEGSILFAGDVAGSVAGRVSRGPAAFIADREQAEASLRRVADLDFRRLLFSHGAEVDEPAHGLRMLLAVPDVSPRA